MIVNKYKITYSSMTARYDLGYVYATSKEEAEIEARSKATAFSANEKSLINATKVNE